MIFCSIDIETSGLDRENDQILEVGAIIEDTNKQLDFDQIPKFKAIIKHDRISGSIYALNLNSRIIEILANIPNFKQGDNPDEWGVEKTQYIREHNIIKPEDLGLGLFTFLTSNGIEETLHGDVKIIVAGKNFDNFDKPYLLRTPKFTDYIKMGYHTAIDPANLYVDFETDTRLPSLDECLERAGITDEVTHNALLDAWDVVRVMRKKY